MMNSSVTMTVSRLFPISYNRSSEAKKCEGKIVIIFLPINLNICFWCSKESSQGSSVVECLTRDRGAAGSSLTGVTVLCP